MPPLPYISPADRARMIMREKERVHAMTGQGILGKGAAKILGSGRRRTPKAGGMKKKSKAKGGGRKKSHPKGRGIAKKEEESTKKAKKPSPYNKFVQKNYKKVFAKAGSAKETMTELARMWKAGHTDAGGTVDESHTAARDAFFGTGGGRTRQ